MTHFLVRKKVRTMHFLPRGKIRLSGFVLKLIHFFLSSLSLVVTLLKAICERAHRDYWRLKKKKKKSFFRKTENTRVRRHKESWPLKCV